MPKNRKKTPNVAAPSYSTKQEITLKKMGNSCKTKAKGPRKPMNIPISQEFYMAYTELINILSDPV